MYRKIKASKTDLHFNNSVEGETIEEKIRRITNNKEPITDGAPLVYTERKDGVRPEFDIRTDRFEIAVDAMDRIAKEKIAKREERHNPLKAVKGGEGGAADTSPTGTEQS